jgi:hypothetical protein
MISWCFVASYAAARGWGEPLGLVAASRPTAAEVLAE